jgi:TonB-dependent starch-binding outer membrane protein SusC
MKIFCILGIPQVGWPKNLTLKMKLTFLLMFLCFLQLSASVYSQSTKFTFKVDNKEIVEVLREIEDQSKFRFFYLREQVDVERRVSITVNDATVEQILDELFKGREVNYEVMNDFLIVLSKPGSNFGRKMYDRTVLSQQQRAISGTVTDESGQPLPGVSIVIKGTLQGATTNVDGEYVLTDVPSDATLVFSFVGMRSQEVDVGNQTTINIVMEQEVIDIEEIVAIGYGTQKRRDLTGSVSSVSEEDIVDIPVAVYTQALSGKMAGVQVNSVSGRPGGQETIRIRGIGSIGAGNDPLVVVDGFPVSGYNIPPSEIKSIEVLKDASATAIYGSRGGNGVILITTKKGTLQTQVQLNSSVGLQSVRERGMVEVLNARQFAQFKKERYEDNVRFLEGREPTIEDVPEEYRNPEQYGEGTDWVDEVLRDALMTKHDFSISGGNEKIKSRFSANYIDQQGILLETGYRRYNLKLSIDANLSDKFSLGVNVIPSLENRSFGGTGGGRDAPFAAAFLANPMIPVRNPDGSFIPIIGGAGVLGYANPVQQLKEYYSTMENKTGRVLVNSYAEYEIIENLDFRSTFSIERNDNKSTNYKPTTIGAAFNRYPPTEATSAYNTSQYLNWLNENTLHYETNIDKHNIDGLIGFTLEKATNEVGNFSARGFPDDEIRTFNAAPTVSGTTYTSEWSLVSGLARINYSYDGRYLLTATIRQDGSSRFGYDNRWGTFPSFALGWNIANERFMEKYEDIDLLKLRAGYGKSGNFNIGNYTHLGMVTTTDYALNSQLVPGRSITSLGNRFLGWEEIQQLDIGLDLSMYQNRLSFTLDYYEKITSNMLMDIEIPFTSGFSSAMGNRGEVTNKGVELTINSSIIRSSSLNWDVNFNIAHNSNKVTDLESPILSPLSTAHHITEEGYPAGMFNGYVVEGFYNTQEEINSSGIEQPDAIPGSYKYKDINGDGVIKDIEDFDRIGNPYPDFSGGLSTSLKYKNIDFNMSATYSYGAEVLQKGGEDFLNLDGVFNVATMSINRWRSPEDPGDGVVPRAISRVIHRYMFSTWVYDGSYIWIRNVTLGYTFNSDQYGFLNTLGLDNVRTYINLSNPWISNTNVQNPEVSTNPGDPLRPGETRNTDYPITKIYTFGININL